LGAAPFLGANSALIELKIASRHHRRYRVLKLRKAVPDKQNGEPVERRDETLKLHAPFTRNIVSGILWSRNCTRNVSCSFGGCSFAIDFLVKPSRKSDAMRQKKN
jgi:hypothetical protein